MKDRLLFAGKTLKRVLLLTIVLGLNACTDNNDTPAEIDVQTISEEMAAVRDYVPLYAVIAHRGSTYWAPEETESAWRWAREMGADYLESDLQCSKDGIIIANHDDNLKRTTNIEDVFGSAIPATRIAFYESLGFSHEDALEQYQRDEASFRPYYMQSYYYAELLMLDAGKWFAEAFAASRNGSMVDGKLHYSTGQYVSALRDQIAYASGKMLHRKDNGERILPYHIKPEYQGKTLHDIWQSIVVKGVYDDVYMDFLDYDFADGIYGYHCARGYYDDECECRWWRWQDGELWKEQGEESGRRQRNGLFEGCWFGRGERGTGSGVRDKGRAKRALQKTRKAAHQICQKRHLRSFGVQADHQIPRDFQQDGGVAQIRRFHGGNHAHHRLQRGS